MLRFAQDHTSQHDRSSIAMAMAARSLPRLLATASRLRASPAFSVLLAPEAPVSSRGVAQSSAFVESDPTSFAWLRLDRNLPSCLRVSFFSVVDGGLRRSALDGHRLSCSLGSNEPFGLQILAGQEIHGKGTRCFSTKVLSPSLSDPTVVTMAEGEEESKPKTLEDFQHEEIVGPTVERDVSPVADELRASLDSLQKRMVSFQKSLVALGCVQGVGAGWCYVSSHGPDPTWLLVPSVLLSLTMAYVLRQALQPIAFFGKLEERSRLRIITLSLMVTKGFGSFFNRARILVAASAVGILCILLYDPSTYLLGLLGILK